jgi:hypothetical protein
MSLGGNLNMNNKDITNTKELYTNAIKGNSGQNIQINSDLDINNNNILNANNILGKELSIVNGEITNNIRLIEDASKDIISLNNTSSDLNNWIDRSVLKLSGGNNSLCLGVSQHNNDRNAYIQVGHQSGFFPSSTGDLYIQPFNGESASVKIGGGTQSAPNAKLDVEGNMTMNDFSIFKVGGLNMTNGGNIDMNNGDIIKVNDLSVNGVSILSNIQANDANLNSLNTSQDVNIGGNLIVNGSQTIVNTEKLDVSDNIITINKGQNGTPLNILESGIIINRGSEEDYKFIFKETTNSFNIGISGELQPVLTRELSSNMNNNGVLYWDNSNNRAINSSNVIIDSSNQLNTLSDLNIKNQSNLNIIDETNYGSTINPSNYNQKINFKADYFSGFDSTFEVVDLAQIKSSYANNSTSNKRNNILKRIYIYSY